MDVARVRHGARERGRRARPDGNIGASRERQHRPRVAGRCVEIDIADDGRHAKDLRRRRGAGVKERERVVDSGVDVDDNGLGMLGHGVNLAAVSLIRLIVNRCGAIFSPEARSRRQTGNPRRALPSQRANSRTATIARPIARPIQTPTAPSGVAKPSVTPTGAPIAQ